MYKYNCYIENTKETREWLENIGIILEDGLIGGNLLVVYNGAYYCGYELLLYDLIYNKKETIYDCLDNLPLFKALTAVRGDIDIKQWFTNGVEWVNEKDYINYNELISFGKSLGGIDDSY